MTHIKITQPSERQREFLTSSTRYTAYGGARGGGKSWAVRTKAALMSLKYPGIRILLVRKTYPELRENHIVPLVKMLRDVADYSESKKTLTLCCGSRIKFGYCDAETDTGQYQGQEYDFIFIDEATQMEEEVFIALKASLRGANDYPKRIYLTCNPGGVGHSWVKRLFVDRRFLPSEDPLDYRFIPARLSDNQILRERDPSYLKALQSLPEDLRRAWLDGCWDVFKGQYFEEFSRDLHVVEPFEIPSSYRRFVAFDYGLDMLACLWFAVSPDGWIYVYRELHQPGLIVSEAAKKILEYSCGEEPEELYMPPDMASRQKDSGRTMAELFYENGISGKAADNRRVAGWLAVKELLKPVSDPYGGKTPRLRIFKNCTTLIAHLPALVRDEKNGSDASSHPHEITHICDALRYFALSYREKEPPVPALSPLEEAKRKALKRAKTGSRRSAF